VFTHHSVFPRSRGHFEEPDCHGHYEKLEHVGDSILGMVVTTWLHELKPGLTCGTATVG
jgi:dsRNA-specific ribonuclease